METLSGSSAMHGFPARTLRALLLLFVVLGADAAHAQACTNTSIQGGVNGFGSFSFTIRNLGATSCDAGFVANTANGAGDGLAGPQNFGAASPEPLQLQRGSLQKTEKIVR